MGPVFVFWGGFFGLEKGRDSSRSILLTEILNVVLILQACFFVFFLKSLFPVVELHGIILSILIVYTLL